MLPTRALRTVLFTLGLIGGLSFAQDDAMDHGSMNMDAAPMDSMPDHGNATHGDHNPAFGGLVLMYGVLHFEIVARPEGAIQLHLSDAMRTPMPATTVSDVTVEVERADGSFEAVAMALSDAGDFWQGSSAPLEDGEATTVHLAFVAFGDPYIYALPLSAVQAEQASAAPLGTDATRIALVTDGHAR
ncbi:MAG: hypothetical protein V2I82_07310 [Halieaceae bacterium]|jgi:hypothetical protein|nr:hypothetical protein [Halieaceae bacterium]